MRMSVHWGIALSTTLLLGCAAPPEGLAPTGDGDGPEVIFELLRKPLPELPFPNDIATRPDPSSPTGLRLNASLSASTHLERVARRRIDQLTGFGVYQPISLRFDAAIDLGVIYERHRDYRTSSDGSDYNFANDAVFVFDVTPGSPTYLQPVALDFGEGNFPQLLRTPHQYWEHDPKTITRTLAFETHNEDINGNGLLDPGEDIDLDGHLDVPNRDPREDGDPNTLDINHDLVSFYEFETNTLIFRPIVPLLEKTTYAVVVTKRLRDGQDRPVRSPFAFVNHTAQTEDLTPALAALGAFDLGADDIAFAWSFTTQDASGDMVRMRDGLYGDGALAWLADDNPPKLASLTRMRDTNIDKTPATTPYILPAEQLRPLIAPLAGTAFGDLGTGSITQLVRNHDYYGFHISGTFMSPRLLSLGPDTHNLDQQAWPYDLTDPALRERIEYEEVRFWCTIPKREYLQDPTKPAPIMLYAHGYTSNKIEQLGLGLHAKFGLAGCSIDAVGHGLAVGDQEELVSALFANIGASGTAQALLAGRIEDVDGDGIGDPGSEFFTGYMFKTRDNLRQTLTDWLTLVRLLRTFGEPGQLVDVDGDGVPDDINADGIPDLLGDFDGDSIIDLGGKDVEFFASGTSLGGLVSSMLAAVEPGVVAAAPISGGAGLIDLTLRSEQGGVVEAVGLRMFGPAIVGEPAEGGGTRIYELFVNGNKVERRDIAKRDDIEPGDVIMVTNLQTGEARCTQVMPDLPPTGYENYVGWPQASNCSANDQGLCRTCPEGSEGSYACDLARSFRVAIASDAGDPIKIEIFEGSFAVRIEGDARDCVVDGEPTVRGVIDTFEFSAEYRGQQWSPGDELVALEDGFGFQRATPLLRRFLGIAQMVVEGADPAVYAPHYARYPLNFMEHGEARINGPTNVLNVTTVGDANVPVNTGIAIAKVAGLVELYEPDPRYGKTVNRVLIDQGIAAGIPWLETSGPDWGPVLSDVDNLSASMNTSPMDSDGANDGRVAPRLNPPLRILVPTPGSEDDPPGRSGLTLPLQNEFNGAHGFPPPGLSGGPFDMGQYMEHQIGLYFRDRGAKVHYDICMEELDMCEFIPSPPPRP